MAWLGVVWVVHEADPDAQVCHLKRMTGVPCPTCGLTRGCTAILEDQDVARGIAFNPLVMTLGIVAVLLLGGRLLFGRLLWLEMSRKERRIVLWALVAAALANWAYVILYVG